MRRVFSGLAVVIVCLLLLGCGRGLKESVSEEEVASPVEEGVSAAEGVPESAPTSPDEAEISKGLEELDELDQINDQLGDDFEIDEGEELKS